MKTYKQPASAIALALSAMNIAAKTADGHIDVGKVAGATK